MREPYAPLSRVLTFQLHAGCSATCVLDGFGLAPKGWFTSRVATQTVQSLDRFLHRAVKRFRPSAIVLGVSRRTGPFDLELRRRAFRALRSVGVPVVVRQVREAYSLLRGRIRGTHREELATTIVDSFLPALRSSFSPQRVRIRRSAWHALAVALVELLHRFPRATAALTTSRAFSIPGFREALLAAERRQYPDAV